MLLVPKDEGPFGWPAVEMNDKSTSSRPGARPTCGISKCAEEIVGRQARAEEQRAADPQWGNELLRAPRAGIGTEATGSAVESAW